MRDRERLQHHYKSHKFTNTQKNRKKKSQNIFYFYYHLVHRVMVNPQVGMRQKILILYTQTLIENVCIWTIERINRKKRNKKIIKKKVLQAIHNTQSIEREKIIIKKESYQTSMESAQWRHGRKWMRLKKRYKV